MTLLVLAGGAVSVTALLVNAAFPLRGRLANLLGLACLCFAQIVLLSEILSELRLIGRAGFLIGHFLLLSLAFALWWRRGRPDLRASWWFNWQEASSALRQHALLKYFLLAVLAVSLLNLVLTLIASPRWVTWDPLTYHLPRAYFWAENGTARHYITEDLRQTEFPPNASFCYMWVMLLSRSNRWLATPSWLAGLLTAAAIAGLARAAGQRRSAALFCGLVFLTMPLPITHMATEYADLITAGSGVCFLFFSLQVLRRQAAGEKLCRSYEVAYAGLAFGLLLGSKYTAFYLLPGAAVGLALYAWLALKREAFRPLLALAAACVIGFAFLGSYNYILNTLDFGNPITTEWDLAEATSDLARANSSPELTRFQGNLARYVYQMLDWSLFGGGDSPLYRAHLRLVQWIDHVLRLHMVAGSYVSWETLSFRYGHPVRTGFGPVGYAVTLASPCLLIVWLLRARRAPQYLPSGLLLAIGWAFLVIFSALTAWSTSKTHHFQLLMALLVAGVLPWCYSHRRRAVPWHLPIMLLTSATAAFLTLLGIGRPLQLHGVVQGRPLFRLGAGVDQKHVALLRNSLPSGAAVGFSGQRPPVFVFVEHLPELRYVNVERADIEDALVQGKLAAVLQSPLLEVHTDQLLQEGLLEQYLVTSCARCPSGLHALPFLDHPYTRCLYVLDPMSFLWDHRQEYGYDVVSAPAGPRLEIRDWSTLTSLGKTWNYNFLTVALPTPGLLALDAPLQLAIEFSGDVRAEEVLHATYNGQPVTAQIEPGQLTVKLPEALMDRQAPLQLCTITFTEGRVVYSWQESIGSLSGGIAVQRVDVTS